MKTISISLSNKCVKTPKCSFCYQDHNQESFDRYDIKSTLRDIRDDKLDSQDEITIAFEYNGFNIQFISTNLPFFNMDVTKTVTTMPETINDIVTGHFKNNGVKSIALSYDSEKVGSPDDWLKKGIIVREGRLHLSCNYLIEEIPFEIPKSVMRLSDQVNLLSLKPNNKLNNQEKGFIEKYLNKIKSYSTEPTLDNSLGVQLGYEDKCKKGEEFVHVKPDGTTEDCCFKNQCLLYEE